MESISIRLKQIRNEWNLNQVEFAKRLGVTNSHISAMEKGKTAPSTALIKLICREFHISEQWLISGVGSSDTDELEHGLEQTMMSITERLNIIRTQDVLTIRSRVIQIEALFVDIIDLPRASEEAQASYLDICYKMFYHLNNYLTFQKKSSEQGQIHMFPFPDDLFLNLKADVESFEAFFNNTSTE